jgi:ribosome assembly protein RRB1
MSKRPGDDKPLGALKGGDRPDQMDIDDDSGNANASAIDREIGEFADEFEDEFESEDEIMEAGVDGRPDAEREAEEKRTSIRSWTCPSPWPFPLPLATRS